MTFAFEITAIVSHGNAQLACMDFITNIEVLKKSREAYSKRLNQLENHDEGSVSNNDIRLKTLQQTINTVLENIQNHKTASMFVATATVFLSGEYHLPKSAFEEELDEGITMLKMEITFPSSPGAFMTYEESTDSFTLFSPVISVQLASSVICPRLAESDNLEDDLTEAVKNHLEATFNK